MEQTGGDLTRFPVDDRLAMAVDPSHNVVLTYEWDGNGFRHTISHVGRLLGAVRGAWVAVRSVEVGAPPEDAFAVGGPVRLGTPITTEQACRAVLRMIHSPILGDIEADPHPGYTLERIYRETDDGRLYEMLSSGEQRLVDIAWGIWRPGGPVRGEGLSGLGGLDLANRRRLVVVLAYLHLGRDLPLEVGTLEWEQLFGDRPRPLADVPTSGRL